jgi:hypothetical protein
MKSLIVLAIALALAPAAGAQLYKYTDKNGKTVYSDQPPADVDSKQVKGVGSNAPAAAPAASKSAVERDKDLDKARKEAREKADKQAKAGEKDREAEQRCTQARERVAFLAEGGRIYKTDVKGERVFMDDAEIESSREKARRDMDEACKKN